MPRAKTAQRNYGWSHQALRQAWAPKVALGTVSCSRCGQLIRGGKLTDRTWAKSWHLDHDDHDRSRYRGPSHALCNTLAAINRTKDPRPTPRQTWR